MIFVKIILLLLIAFISSPLVGNALHKILGRYISIPGRIGLLTYIGGVTIILVGSIAFGVGGCLGLSAKLTFVIMVLILAIIAVAGAMAGRYGSNNHATLDDNRQPFKAFHVVVLIVALVLIAIQIIVVTFGIYSKTVAMAGIPVSTAVRDMGVCVKGSPIMNMWGAIALLMNVHSLSFIYTILPMTLFCLYYLGYYELAMIFTDNDRAKSLTALIVISILSIWGYQSDAFASATLMFAWYSGISYVLNGLLVALCICLLHYKPDKAYGAASENDIQNEEDDDYQEEWDMKKHKIINARNLAIALGVVVVMLVSMVFVLNNKINSLHDATANLQRDLDNRCSIYEFTAADGVSYGYLIKGKDGKLTMIGGGDAQRADDLYDFLKEYGTEITNWYLYDGNEDNVGAYLKCTNEKGITSENVYILNRVEIEGL